MRKFFLKFKKRTQNEDGAVMILFVFLLIILLGFAALAFDYGMVYYKDSKLQTAVDIAARAAARQYADIKDIDEAVMTDEQKQASLEETIKYYLEKNGFPEDELKVCNIKAEATGEISIDARTDVELNFARVFTDKPIPISAGTAAVTNVTVDQGVPAAIDVVFVLDVSSSMYKSDKDRYPDRFVPMVKAVNSCIDQIMTTSPNSRVGVVTYGSKQATQVILNMTSNPKNEKPVSGYTAFSPNYIGYSAANSSSGQPGWVRLFTKDGETMIDSSGTYIQYGIAMGGRTLLDLAQSETTPAADGFCRFPIVFVLTDGEATLGTREWKSENVAQNNTSPFYSNSYVFGSSADDDVLEVSYYTMLTANYWKDRLTSAYNIRNKQVTGVDEEVECKFYTLSFFIEGVVGSRRDMAKGVMNPPYLDKSDAEINYHAQQLRNWLKSGYEPGYFGHSYLPDNYDYVEEYYEADDGASLEKMLERFADAAVEPVKTYSTKLTR